MVMSPDKFEAILLDKQKSDLTNERINVDNEQVKVASSVNLLGLQIDNKLNFNLHISNIYGSAANHLNTLMRLKNSINFEQKKTLINSFFIANFIYCSLIWTLLSASSLKKIENLEKEH